VPCVRSWVALRSGTGAHSPLSLVCLWQKSTRRRPLSPVHHALPAACQEQLEASEVERVLLLSGAGLKGTQQRPRSLPAWVCHRSTAGCRESTPKSYSMWSKRSCRRLTERDRRSMRRCRIQVSATQHVATAGGQSGCVTPCDGESRRRGHRGLRCLSLLRFGADELCRPLRCCFGVAVCVIRWL
jgi:hypothetical protein